MQTTRQQRLWMYEAMYRSRRLTIPTVPETVIGRDQVVGRIETA